MHAVLVSVQLHQDFEDAKRVLEDEVVPRVSQAPGFVAGYWLAPQDGRGFSIVVSNRRKRRPRAADMARSMTDEQRTVQEVEVREVVAHA